MLFRLSRLTFDCTSVRSNPLGSQTLTILIVSIIMLFPGDVVPDNSYPPTTFLKEIFHK